MTIKVYVYRDEYERTDGKRRGYTLAYTRYQTAGACIHEVEAVNGYEAKKLATKEHKDKCENRVTP